MAIQHIFDDASRVMTVVSFVCFLGILAWTFVLRREQDFAATAAIPFDDDVEDDYV
ncbi:cbb3-type cytochrome oxidase subunit 3 [Massilia sp. CT11-137]|uniref:cbb3-type cytochrome oxidase subunit 3 n=1 Tax=Massilia sp. CT11-137 TaxID=3393901 RepID=UPI0039A48AD7